jgi:hypothetical protein
MGTKTEIHGSHEHGEFNNECLLVEQVRYGPIHVWITISDLHAVTKFWVIISCVDNAIKHFYAHQVWPPNVFIFDPAS